MKGVNIIPSILPRTELNIAAASFPPTALVRITADDTGGGMHDTVTNLREHTQARNYTYNIDGTVQYFKLMGYETEFTAFSNNVYIKQTESTLFH